MNNFWDWIDKDGSGVTMFGALCFLIFTAVLVRAHMDRRNPINLTDLIVEPVAGQKKITMSRFVAFTGFLLGAWVFVYCAKTAALKDSWEAIGGFMGVCFAYRGWDSYLKNRRDSVQTRGRK